MRRRRASRERRQRREARRGRHVGRHGREARGVGREGRRQHGVRPLAAAAAAGRRRPLTVGVPADLARRLRLQRRRHGRCAKPPKCHHARRRRSVAVLTTTKEKRISFLFFLLRRVTRRRSARRERKFCVTSNMKELRGSRFVPYFFRYLTKKNEKYIRPTSICTSMSYS